MQNTIQYNMTINLQNKLYIPRPWSFSRFVLDQDILTQKPSWKQFLKNKKKVRDIMDRLENA